MHDGPRLPILAHLNEDLPSLALIVRTANIALVGGLECDRSRPMPLKSLRRAPAHKRILETTEIKHITDADTRRAVAVTGVRVTIDEAILEAEKVKDFIHRRAGYCVAINARLAELLLGIAYGRPDVKTPMIMSAFGSI